MNVLFIDEVHPVLEQELTANGYHCIDGTGIPVEQLPELVENAHGIVIRSRIPMNEAFLKHAPELRFIARSGAGMENIDVTYCEQRKIVLFNSPEGNRNAVAEHALGMLLALFNQLLKADAEVREGIWEREGNRGHEIAGKTVGIIGYGNNGSQFAKVLSGFGCEILAYDKYKQNFGTERIKEASLEEIFEKADIVSFHIPQNNETLFWGSAPFFSSFKKPVYLINLSRGKIVSIADLLQAIEAGKVLGACLDVLEFEKSSFENMFDGTGVPETFRKLLENKKVILSPHVGGWTAESYYKLSKVLAEKILAEFGSW